MSESDPSKLSTLSTLLPHLGIKDAPPAGLVLVDLSGVAMDSPPLVSFSVTNAQAVGDGREVRLRVPLIKKNEWLAAWANHFKGIDGN